MTRPRIVPRDLHQALCARGWAPAGRVGDHPAYRHADTGEMFTVPGTWFDGPSRARILARADRLAGQSNLGRPDPDPGGELARALRAAQADVDAIVAAAGPAPSARDRRRLGAAERHRDTLLATLTERRRDGATA